MKDIPEAVERSERQVERLRLYSSYQEQVGIDGEAIEFELKIFSGFSSLSTLEKNQRRLGDAENQARGVHRLDYLHVNVQ